LEYNLKIFGTGLLVRVAQLDEQLCHKIKSICSRDKVDCSQVIFDVDLIRKIGFDSWSGIPCQDQSIWIEVNNRNSMEVTSVGKKLIKTVTWDIVDPSYLFPIYRVEENNFFDSLPVNSLVFGEVVTGQLHKSTFTCDSFLADQLSFQIVKPFQNFQHLNISEISYSGEALQSKSNQFITRSFFAFVR
jgi:hypothetical protein